MTNKNWRKDLSQFNSKYSKLDKSPAPIKLNNKKKFFFILIVLAMFLLALTTFFIFTDVNIKQNDFLKQRQLERLNAIEQQLTQAEAALIYNDKNRASELIQKAEIELINTPAQTSDLEIQSKWNQLWLQLKNLKENTINLK